MSTYVIYARQNTRPAYAFEPSETRSSYFTWTHGGTWEGDRGGHMYFHDFKLI